MLATGLFAIVIMVRQTSVPPTPSRLDSVENEATPTPPYDVMPRSRDEIALHSQVVGGSRDPVWSSQMEAALSRAYLGAPDFADSVETLLVTCTESLCEVQASTEGGLSQAAVEAFMGSMPPHALFKLEDELKLQVATQTANTTGYPAFDEDYAGNILAYWVRADGS